MVKLPNRLKRVTLISIAISLALLVSILLAELLFQKLYPFPKNFKYGVTFSPKFAQSLGLNWQDTYIKVLDDLKVKNLRIPGYWDEMERMEMDYDFSAVDFMLDKARERGAKAILVLGARQPRWPECHIPSWAKNLSLKDRQKKTLEFIGRVLERYKHHTAILAWQVENEPLLSSFGQGCDPPDKDFLKKEVELVRKINGKEIIVTDSGELGSWIIPMKLSDIFGTTLYRTVYNPVLGYTSYPLLPYLYNIHATFIRSIFAPNNLRTIIIELQAEPWSPANDLISTSIDKQRDLFPLEKFKSNISFAQKTGFDEIYLWGVEWWFWMVSNNNSEYLDYARDLFIR